MRLKTLFFALLGAIAMFGCRNTVHFPTSSLAGPAEAADGCRAYDIDGDGTADFYTFANDAGRVVRIGYDDDGNGTPGEIVNMDAIELSHCRHIVIILDGFAYDLVREYYDNGGLRMLHAPSRVVAPYPTLTDLCMEDALGYIPCEGFEALYFNARKNKLVGGAGAYMRGENEPYNKLLDYRANLIWDAIGYVFPVAVFGKELNDAMEFLEKHDRREVLAYFVSSAGVSTTRGADGQRASLEKVDQFINQIVWQTRGLTKVTLLSDHGHSYTPAKRIPLEDHLREYGWRLTKSLSGEKDVVYIRFGLETYASFATRSPAALAGDLSAAEGVEIASYADGEDVVVLGADASRAIVREKNGRFAYEQTAGDPLKLAGILQGLQPDVDGYYDAEALLAATGTHEYPAPLQRIWRAHLAQVLNPPDVIVSLADDYFSGARSFAGSVKVGSTHGGLNYTNSVTFIASSIGPLPELMRSRDIPANMSELLGEPWPMGE